ncbi:MAG: DUF1788 domain-containing protein [Oscillospiraceae bacterium]
MAEINTRLDELRRIVQTPEFLGGRGLSFEENIRIFSYDAKNEPVVQHFIEQIVSDQSINCHLIERNLYSIFLSLCEEMDILDAIPEMEESDGDKYTIEQLYSTIGTDEFVQKIDYTPHLPGDVLVLTGVGDVFPFMRVHVLLNALQPYFSDIPVLVMYPGKFDSHDLKLFDKLKPNDYYRAFNMI